MGRYRARDLLLPPNLVSFLRLPLAVLFVYVVDEPQLALVTLFASGATDVVDGFLARRLKQATPTGAVVDAVFDKIFAATVIVTLIVNSRLAWPMALLLGTREIGELPLVVWWMLRKDRRQARAEDPRANWLGKAVTVLQFASVAAVLQGSFLETPTLAATAVAGTIAAFFYWKRELEL
ncbi:MAG TPA: CDP-alcohol phosphatidyltransferase family protein [Polyangiaceae bacterium]|nr:CDP-alcohol phosphatidyltransferase family protein [Polyangiaceae bacterium]